MTQVQLIQVVDTSSILLSDSMSFNYVLTGIPDTFDMQNIAFDTSQYCDLRSIESTAEVIFNCESLGAQTIDVEITDQCGNTRRQSIKLNIIDSFGYCRDCPDILFISDPNLPSNEYRARVIHSNTLINNPSTIIFSAEDSIMIYPGFQIETGASFEAMLENCGSDNENE